MEALIKYLEVLEDGKIKVTLTDNEIDWLQPIVVVDSFPPNGNFTLSGSQGREYSTNLQAIETIDGAAFSGTYAELETALRLTALLANGLLVGGVPGGAGRKDFISNNVPTNISSTSNVIVDGMSITLQQKGAYTAQFNAQYHIPYAASTTVFNTATAKADLNLIYADITSLTVTNPSHGLAFGSGETLTAGVYSVAGAISVAGILNLDGQSNPNAVFVIHSTGGAITSAAGVTINLINGTKSSNVYWVAQGVISIGANSTFNGTLLSNTAAVSVGASCIMSGRLLTKGGALAFVDLSSLSVPTDTSFIDFRSLSDFVMFTGLGGVSNTGTSTYNGDISTDSGAITGFSTATVNGTVFPSGSSSIITPVYHEATFGIYANGVLIPNSERTVYYSQFPAIVNLQAAGTLLTLGSIDVRCRVDTQTSDVAASVDVNNRIIIVNT